MRVKEQRSYSTNPIKFEDVAMAARIRWVVGEKQALDYFRKTFATPQLALKNLEQNVFPPDEFWASL